MSRAQPAADCHEAPLPAGYPMGDAAEVALEDYAREVARAREAAAFRGADGRVLGVHLCGVAEPPSSAVLEDIEGFARSLVSQEGGGLGWS